ncbi:hypothetical protein JX266_014231 [Neoarthrinium moseri]|nr:hypothetical protein JX266_014231 [Neoarthrinium moseri]
MYHPEPEGVPSQVKEPSPKVVEETRVEYLAVEDLSHEDGIVSEATGTDPSTHTPIGSSLDGSLSKASKTTVVLRANDGRCLFEFNIPVGKATVDRFHKISTPICMSLKEYVKKTPAERLAGKIQLRKVLVKDRSLAVRLMVLGETKPEAKPHIVVLGAQGQYKRLRKFFEKKSVQSLIKPSDDACPSFEYLIYEHPPDLKQAENDDFLVLAPVEVGDHSPVTQTLCGTPIIIRHPSSTETRATFGGIIKVIDDAGLFKLYGLTAGHVVEDKDDDAQSLLFESSSTEFDYLFPSDSDSESDLDCETSSLINEMEGIPENTSDTKLRIGPGAWSSLKMDEIGAISRHSPQLCRAADRAVASMPTCDWALIEMLTYKPNQLPPRTQRTSDNIHTTSVESNGLVMPTSNYKGTEMPVAVISGSEGLKRGVISALPAKIMLGSCDKFVDAMIMNPHVGQDIVDGDSGSWVVNETTFEVLGHLVATDRLGGAYIMPLEDTLSEIKDHLQAKSVELASPIDIVNSATSKTTKTMVITPLEHLWKLSQQTETPLSSTKAHMRQGDADEGKAEQSFSLEDPFSLPTGLLVIGGVTLKSVMALHGLIRSLGSQNKDARALKAEVSDLSGVLSSLMETVANNPSLNFEALKGPLQRCGKSCEEYSAIIARCTKRSDGTTRLSMRDWITQKYLQGDINDFRTMLSAHKSTIIIALACENLRDAAISPDVLEDYKDMVSDTTSDLDTHLRELQEKIDCLKNGQSAAIDEIAIEWQALLEEKESTKQGLDMCAKLASRIAHFEPTATEHAQFSQRQSARKHLQVGLSETRQSIQFLVARLQTHETLISSQLESISLNDVANEPVAAQLARLQQTKDSVSQCIQIVSEASRSANEQSNVFEDLPLADNSYGFSVSTVQDIVTARRLNLSGRSRHFGGQVTDETVQKPIDALTQLDAEHLKFLKDTRGSHRPAEGIGSASTDSTNAKVFHDRFGPGLELTANKPGQ